VYIACHHCGEKQWFDMRRNCELCGSTLRRCVDCTHYDRPGQKCQATGGEIDLQEAEQPGALAVSALCQQYRPVASVIRGTV